MLQKPQQTGNRLLIGRFVRLQLPPEAPNFKMNYPYPKKAIVKHQDTYRDGGTKTFRVINEEEIGLKYIFQDFRIRSTSKGKFYTGYPGEEDSVEIVHQFIHIQE